jgi:hypothetical protein
LALPVTQVEAIIPKIEEVYLKESEIKEQLLRGRSLAEILKLRGLPGGQSKSTLEDL